MRIYTKVVMQFDDRQGKYVDSDAEYFEYDGTISLLCGASQGQKDIANQQSATYNQMVQQATQVFGDSSKVFGDLMSTFAPTLAAGPNQEGFSQAEKSALQSSAITQTGQAYRNAKQAAGEAMAAQGGGNVGDVTGGSNAAINLGIAENAANQTSSELNQIDQADYAVGRQNYAQAAAGLAGATNVFNPATTAENAATGSGEAAANTENQISQQNNSWVSSVTGALGGIAGAALTGGMSNLGKGVGFFGSGAKNGNKGSN